jgi:peptidoglycan L-alanyl-D-glutamate endopeptidase CwlK
MAASLSVGLIDFAVIEGVRSKEKQNKYFDEGKSKVRWPNGKHNVRYPNDKAKAVDIVPYVNGKISWKKEHCIFLAGIVMTMAKILNLGIVWGGNWNKNLEPVTDQSFDDLVHFQLED